VLLALPVLWAARRVDADALGDGLRIAWGFAAPAPDASDAIRMAALLEWLLPAALALVLVWLRLSGRLGMTAFAALAIALVALDLFKADMGYNPAIRERDAVQPATAAIQYLQRQRPNRFAGLHPEAPITLAVPIPANVAMRYGLYDARGYDFPFEKRYAELWRRVIAESPDCNYAFCPESAGRSPRALRALGLLGVTDLLQNRGDPPLRDLQVAYAGDDARVYRNPEALPRAFLVGRQQVVDGGDAARAAIAAPSFEPRTTAVTEKTIPGIGGSGGVARISHYGEERVDVETQAAHRSLLVLTDSWFPGWKARVDGDEVPIERVDYLIRGVPVPAGNHRVEFSYEPASWRAGWIVSLLALIAIAAAALIGWRRRG
jgi:Bacterial membrane protein YfhO